MSEMKVVPLRPAMGCENIPDTLRRIADDIEAGTYADWPVTIAVLVTGHEEQRPEGDGTAIRTHWETHGLGPKGGSVFACRGLLTSVLGGMSGE